MVFARIRRPDRLRTVVFGGPRDKANHLGARLLGSNRLARLPKPEMGSARTTAMVAHCLDLLVRLTAVGDLVCPAPAPASEPAPESITTIAVSIGTTRNGGRPRIAVD